MLACAWTRSKLVVVGQKVQEPRVRVQPPAQAHANEPKSQLAKQWAKSQSPTSQVPSKPSKPSAKCQDPSANREGEREEQREEQRERAVVLCRVVFELQKCVVQMMRRQGSGYQGRARLKPMNCRLTPSPPRACVCTTTAIFALSLPLSSGHVVVLSPLLLYSLSDCLLSPLSSLLSSLLSPLLLRFKSSFKFLSSAHLNAPKQTTTNHHTKPQQYANNTHHQTPHAAAQAKHLRVPTK